MSTPGLVRPSSPVLRRVSPPERGRAPSSAPLRRRGSSYERVLAWSLLGSAAVHLLVLLLSPAVIRVGVPPGGAEAPRDLPAPWAIQLIEPVVRDDAAEPPRSEAEVAARELPARLPSERTLDPRGDARVDAGETSPEETSTAPASPGAVLRPGPRDARLWVEPKSVPLPEKSDHERYMENLQAQIDAINDSIYGRGPDTDWTVKDGKGRRWGISPEGVHLGGVTIPRGTIPIPDAGGDLRRREEEREKERQRGEIQGQEERRDRESVRRERAEEIRKRKDAERREGGG